MKRVQIEILILIFLFVLSYENITFGWNDETHLSVAKVAGYGKWYNTVGADITKIKASRIESNNHYFNNTKKEEVTSSMVFEQIKRYNDTKDNEGHLYGAIVASLREYKTTAAVGKYAGYHLAFCSHYIGDLSHPLHNTQNDDFNRKRHARNDGIVEDEVWENILKIKKEMYPIILRSKYFEKDLSREIARIANISRNLGYKIRKEDRDMTKEEAYSQLGHSASLLKAVLVHFKKSDNSRKNKK